MYLIKQTEIFSKWIFRLKDIKGKVAILRRIERIKKGNFGDYKSIGADVSELRITVGAGYRVHYTKTDDEIVILLVGEDKSTQRKDIARAKQLVEELKNE